MKKSNVMAVCLLATAFTVRVADAQAPNQHLKKFEHFIGRWILKDVVREETPLVSKGAKIIAYNEFSWTPNRQAVIFNWTLKVEDQEPIHANHLIVWDKRKEEITCYWQRSDGEQGTTDWRFEGNMLVGHVQSIDTEGRQGSSMAYLQPTGKDELTWWSTNLVRDGKSLPDIGKYTYSRID